MDPATRFDWVTDDLEIAKSYKENADMLISYCPFCMQHIGGVCNSKGEELNMKDISVVLAESILGK